MNEIISRNEWGAQYADGTGPRPIGNLIRILHHTGDADPTTEEPLPSPSALQRFLNDERIPLRDQL